MAHSKTPSFGTPGQRRRGRIACALYHGPEVLVMDEATSALDNQTERQFVEALERLQGSHTLIVIAHRLSTVRNCDTLFMLEEGRLVAERELRRTDGNERNVPLNGRWVEGT